MYCFQETISTKHCYIHIYKLFHTVLRDKKVLIFKYVIIDVCLYEKCLLNITRRLGQGNLFCN